jgi:hypothetical protein
MGCVVLAAIGSLVAGCQPGSKSVSAAGAAVSSCAPGSPVLAVTKLCQEQASALLVFRAGAPEPAPNGCTWVVNEAKALGNSALLFRSLRCNGRVAQLEFVPSARAASFDMVASPLGEMGEPATIAIMFDTSGRDPHSVILEAALRTVADPAEKARCKVRRLDGDVAAPADALVVDEVPAAPADGIRSACGEMGFDGGAQSFWRVSQNIAWFFSLGNDAPPVDAESFTLINRNAAGQWVRS